MDVSPVKLRPQFASVLAAKKAAVATAIHVQSLQNRRDAAAKAVIAPDRLDDTRPNPDLTKTFEADDTFANTEAAKVRGGRLDLVV